MKELDSKKKDVLKLQVGALFEMMQSENLEELELKEEDFYIHLKRKSKRVPVSPVAIPAVSVAATPVPAVPESGAEVKPAGETVKSPIIGTMYRSPSPTSAPFVQEGDTVDAGKTLCIVEAMKVMNEIKAEVRMKIVKILVENGKPVMAGQDLFVIEK